MHGTCPARGGPRAPEDIQASNSNYDAIGSSGSGSVSGSKVLGLVDSDTDTDTDADEFIFIFGIAGSGDDAIARTGNKV